MMRNRMVLGCMEQFRYVSSDQNQQWSRGEVGVDRFEVASRAL